MRIPLKLILSACVCLLTVLVFELVSLQRNERSCANASPARTERKHAEANPTFEKRADGPVSERPSSAIIQSPLEAALAERDLSRRRELLKRWAESVDLKQIADTLELTESIANGEWKTEVRAALLSSWGERDLTGAVTWFGNRGGADGIHQQARDLFARELAEREPTAMVSWMEISLPETSRQELYGPLFRQWAKTDPSAVAALLRQMVSPSQGITTGISSAWIDLSGQVAAQWATADVNSAVAWAQSLPEGPAKAKALAQVSYRWTETDPQGAAAYAAQQNNPQLLGNVAAKWAESNPQAAAAWARGLPSGEGGERAIASLTAMWAQKDPMAAATYAASLPPGNSQSRATVAVVSAWAAGAPLETAKWVGQFAEGPVRQNALEQLMNSWAASNACEAAQWLNKLPQTPSRDAAVVAFVATSAPAAPDAAFQWAETISDKDMRLQQLQNAARIWLQKDAAAAQQNIGQSSLPQDVKNRLLSGAAQ